MKRIAVIPNLIIDKSNKFTKDITKILKESGITPVLDNSLKEYGFFGEYQDIEKCLDIDMAVIVGGDGTFLSQSNRYINTSVPVLGINYGHIGFLTELEKGDICNLKKILSGDFEIDKRHIIKATHEENEYFSINEVCIHRGSSPRILDTQIIINGVLMNKFRSDGIIVSTSSGSTAYSLSAGGPIINPLLDAFVITPVCPHNLNVRSIVVPSSDIIEIRLSNTENFAFSTDGKLIAELRGDQTVRVTKGGYLNTVRCDKNSFYNKLKNKIFEKEV